MYTGNTAQAGLNGVTARVYGRHPVPGDGNAGMNILAGTLYLHIYAISGRDTGQSYATVRVLTGRTLPGGKRSCCISLAHYPDGPIFEFMDL